MPGLRIMTYNVRRFNCHRDGLVAVHAVIAAVAPDIVALQEVSTSSDAELEILAQRLGMHLHVAPGRCGNAFLSYYPLHHLQSFSLSGRGCCLRAEIDFAQKRMQFYNVRIDGSGQQEQIDSLLGDDLLGAQHLGVPALILGDFGNCYQGGMHWDLLLALQRATKPLVHGTYPAWFPLLARDRAYILGDLQVLAVEVIRNRFARQASSHLPLLLTVEISDLRKYLKIRPSFRVRKLEIATG